MRKKLTIWISIALTLCFFTVSIYKSIVNREKSVIGIGFNAGSRANLSIEYKTRLNSNKCSGNTHIGDNKYQINTFGISNQHTSFHFAEQISNKKYFCIQLLCKLLSRQFNYTHGVGRFVHPLFEPTFNLIRILNYTSNTRETPVKQVTGQAN